jgi:hypothetical protein
MSSLRPGSGSWSSSAPPALVLALLALAAAARPTPAQAFGADAGWRDVSMAEYRLHLEDLDGVVVNCQTQRRIRSAAPAKTAPASDDACDPARIGPDDRVHGLASGDALPREVRYDWLRSVLGRAENKGAQAKPIAIGAATDAKNHQLGVDALLAEARQRLQEDAKQAESTPEASPSYAGERKSLNAILAQKVYQGVTQVSARERFVEWLYNVLDKILSGFFRFGSRSPWIAFTLRALLLVAICTALIWFLVRIERRSRVRLVPDDAPAPGAPSAREWQLWLEDAHAMAARGLWRDAIHFIYWASIARLESKRLWPADRARTPREYLRLMAASDPRQPSLTALTRSFERTWYGGRAAESDDFHAALELAAALGVE